MADRTKRNRALVKTNRVLAYILLAVATAMIVTGYRTTGWFAFFSRGFADITHRIHLNAAFIVLLAAHSLLSIRTALMRKKISGAYIDALLIVIGTIFIVLFIILLFV